MASVVMSAFASLGRQCLVPRWAGATTGGLDARRTTLHPVSAVPQCHRGLGRDTGGRRRSRSRAHQHVALLLPPAHPCRLGKHYAATLATLMAIITLLLVIFAHNNSYKGGSSWFYSLLVVITGLAFVIFGPLLLCRFLLHAYYRQIDARTLRLMHTDAESQTPVSLNFSVDNNNRPRVYACIIISPQEHNSTFDANQNSRRFCGLPTYEQATIGHSAKPTTGALDSNQNIGEQNCSQTNFIQPVTNTEESSLPTYSEALDIIRSHQLNSLSSNNSFPQV